MSRYFTTYDLIYGVREIVDYYRTFWLHDWTVDCIGYLPIL